MFKKIIFTLLPIAYLFGQDAQAPAASQQADFAITNVTIHIGNGTLIPNGTVQVSKGKIVSVASNSPLPNITIVNGNGQHLYPGIIAASTNLGLVETASIKATHDDEELGDINPSLKAITAYAADSKVINTLRSNGVLLAHIVPQGGTLSGTSSVVQLDAWHYEDAAYKLNNGIHFNMPALINRPNPFRQAAPDDAVKRAYDKIDEVKNFLRSAKAYAASEKQPTNLKYESVLGLFNKTQTLFVHADLVKELLVAIAIKQEFAINIVIVGGSDSYLIATELAANQVPVILSEPHSLPSMADDAVDQPYKTASMLQKAGVLFTICQDAGDGFWQQRCLPFQAGTMAAYGLTKEEALSAITLNAAKILGIDNTTGSIEVGKDANFFTSTGDVLNMVTSNVTTAYIQGRSINLTNKQTELANKYKAKYGIK